MKRVQTRTLGDQGLPDTMVNRAILPYATFLPVRVYLAALNAEVEFLRRHGRPGGPLDDTELARLLDNESDLIAAMDSFRDGLLHPRKDSAADEILLLGYDLYQRIPALQSEIDRAIGRIRVDLRNRVQAVLDRLPETQSLFCRWSSIETCMSDPLLEQDSTYGLGLESELKAVTSRLAEGPGPDDVWRPSEHQRSAARKIADMITATCPFSPTGDGPEPATLQPPMSELLYMPVVMGALSDAGVRSGDLVGKAAANVARNWAGFFSHLQTAAVLVNENVQWLRAEGIAADRIAEHAQMEAWFAKAPLGERVRLAAVGKVAVAILVPLLLVYREVRGENPGAGIDGLDAVANDSDRLRAFQELRKEVFHVTRPSVVPGDLNHGVLEGGSGSDAQVLLFGGLPEFLSWFVPETSRIRMPTEGLS